MPLQFCPISFTLFPSIKRGGKTYSILMHIRGNSDTSSGGIDHSQPSLQSCMPMTSIIRPHGCWLMHSRQVLLSSTPTHQHLRPPPSSSYCFFSPPFPVPSLLCFITYVHSPALSPPPLLPTSFPHSLPHSPLVSLHFCSLFIPSCNQIMVTPCWC